MRTTLRAVHGATVAETSSDRAIPTSVAEMLNHVGAPSLFEIADVLVCLDHVARFIKHADDHPVRARAVLRIRDRAADCVGSYKDWAVPQFVPKSSFTVNTFILGSHLSGLRRGAIPLHRGDHVLVYFHKRCRCCGGPSNNTVKE